MIALIAVTNKEWQARQHSINGDDDPLSTVLSYVSDELTIVYSNKVL
jgi:hypothetical protein